MISADKEKCCACGACVSACHKEAIQLITDANGNYYPIIDSQKCVNCNLCELVCPFLNLTKTTSYGETYAGKLIDASAFKRSASGGAAYAIERAFIESFNGIVYGCGYGSDMVPHHFRVENVEKLKRIQGSKYIRSTVDCYTEIKEEAKQGKKILFCGMPCQCQAVKLFTRTYSNNIYTLELICHGVIDQEYWIDYIRLLEKKNKIKVSDFSFRYKGKQKPFLARYEGYSNRTGNIERYYTTPALSYYYNNFLRGYIFRENCYRCPFANKDRKADITVGDYWGYHGNIDASDGISVIIVNTDKGRQIFKTASPLLEIEKTSFDDAAKTNEQLLKPFSFDKKKYELLEKWAKYGVEFLDNEHKKKHWKAVIASKFGIY